MPMAIPAETIRSQKSLDANKFCLRSKMYWIPCNEHASPYSNTVCVTAFLVDLFGLPCNETVVEAIETI